MYKMAALKESYYLTFEIQYDVVIYCVDSPDSRSNERGIYYYNIFYIILKMTIYHPLL